LEGGEAVKEVIIYFENGNQSTYYHVDNVTWTAKTIYLDIYNDVLNNTDVVCIEKEQVSQILVNVM